MTGTGHLVNSFRIQARACAEFGSPMYTELLDRIVDDVANGVFADVLAGHENDPEASTLALCADHYRYRYPGGGRQRYDIAPVDATNRDGELTLLSCVWPDMTTRIERLRGAIGGRVSDSRPELAWR